MKLLRVIAWVLITICFAYFITDYKVGQQTVKQHIDAWLKSDMSQQLQNKAKSYLKDWVGEAEAPKLIKKEESKPQETVSDISVEDKVKLKKLLEKNQ